MRAPRAVAEVEALLGEVEHLIVRAREVETVHNAQVEAGVVATLANIYSFNNRKVCILSRVPQCLSPRRN